MTERPTDCVTCGWAEGGQAVLPEPAFSQNPAKKRGESHPSGARGVGRQWLMLLLSLTAEPMLLFRILYHTDPFLGYVTIEFVSFAFIRVDLRTFQCC